MTASSPTLTTAPDTFTVTAADGTALFMQHWSTGRRTKALFLVHGLGEHSSRYSHVPAALSSEFSDVFALDLRGHGRSTGVRGYAPSVDTMLDDIQLCFDTASARLGAAVPWYVLGHSMGGLLTLRWLQARRPELKGAIISAPFLAVALEVPAWKEKLGKVLFHTLPKIQLQNEINPSHISHDPAVVEAYVNDRLVHSKITAQLYYGLLEAIEATKADTKPLPCPSLFIVPLEDKLVSAPVTLEFFRNLKDRAKTLKEYPGFYHESMNEVERARVFADILQWVKS
jgi:alpha-beta hydrolase superfamily lysophospholipase